MLDIAVLAGTVVSSFLMPIAKKAVDGITDRLSKEVSEKAADQASSVFSKVWDRVAALFDSDREKATLQEFEKEPDENAAIVQAFLEKKLRHDEAAAKELDGLINQPSVAGGGASIGSIVADIVGVADARGAHISGRAVVGGVVMPGPTVPPRGRGKPEDPKAG